MNHFRNEYSFWNAHGKGGVCENFGLTSTQWGFLNCDDEYLEKLRIFIDLACLRDDGIYTNLPKKQMKTASAKDKNISQDQLLAYAALSEDTAKAIWEKMKFMTYDGRYISLFVWSFIGYRATGKECYLDIMDKCAAFTLWKHKRSGKCSGALKVWTAYRSLSISPMHYFDMSFRKIFWTYYPTDHPIKRFVMGNLDMEI